MSCDTSFLTDLLDAIFLALTELVQYGVWYMAKTFVVAMQGLLLFSMILCLLGICFSLLRFFGAKAEYWQSHTSLEGLADYREALRQKRKARWLRLWRLFQPENP